LALQVWTQKANATPPTLFICVQLVKRVQRLAAARERSKNYYFFNQKKKEKYKKQTNKQTNKNQKNTHTLSHKNRWDKLIIEYKETFMIKGKKHHS
jgi:hypothetical protein